MQTLWNCSMNIFCRTAAPHMTAYFFTPMSGHQQVVNMQKVWRRQWSHTRFDLRQIHYVVEKHWVSDSWIENAISEAPFASQIMSPYIWKKLSLTNQSSTFFARAPIRWWRALAHRPWTDLSSWHCSDPIKKVINLFSPGAPPRGSPELVGLRPPRFINIICNSYIKI